MTASTPRRSRSECQRSTASPTRRAASWASTSSQEPGNRTTPNFTRRRRSPRRARRRRRSPRSAGWPAASRTSPEAARDPRRRARPAAPRARWPRPRTPAPEARARPPGPGGRGSPPWGGSAPAPSRRHPGEPGVERLAGDPLVGLHVLGARARDDVVGDGRGRRGLVPAAAGRPVADVLLVEGRLWTPGLVAVRRPEPRGVGREHLVAERQDAVGVPPELELGVGEDDAVGACVLGAMAVEIDRDVLEALDVGAG